MPGQILWTAIWAIVGAGAGLGLARLAEYLGRRYGTVAGAPGRVVWTCLAAAILFGLAAWRFGVSWRGALTSLYVSILLVVTITDLEHRVVPNRVMLPAILLALVAGLPASWLGWKATLLGGAVGLAFFGLAYLLAARLYPGKVGLGMGDVTLATFIGLASGFPGAAVAVVLGVLIGGVGSLLLLLTRRATLRSAIPYGPFLVAGGLVALYWGREIALWYVQRYR